MADRVSIGVIGSVNLDMVATADTLPSPGQTVTCCQGDPPNQGVR